MAKQRGNQNLYIEKEQTTQWPNKGVIRIYISKKNRQHNGQKKKIEKDKQRSTKHTHKIRNRVTRTPLKTGGELRCSGRIAVPAPLVAPVVLF